MIKFKELKKSYKETKKSTIVVYLILRTLVILIMIRQVILGEYNNAFFCLLSLVLFTVPFRLQKKFKITLPNTLEIIILCFIFAAEILGELNSFYIVIPHFDTILHTLNGFLAAGIGLSLFDLLNKNIDNINLSPIFLVIVAFCFSMTIGILWEFFEYGSDKLINADMQKDVIVQNISSVTLDETKSNTPIIIDNIKYTIIYSEDKDGNIKETLIENGYLDIGINDTMKDLIVNFIGATIFSVFGYLYLLNRDKYKFVNQFMIKKQK